MENPALIQIKPMQKPEKILYFSTGIIVCMVAVSGILFYCFKINLVNYISDIPLCPFHAVTGKPCPGCGMSRAFLLLGQLKITEALRMNMFSLPFLMLMIIFFVKGSIPLWLQNKFLVYTALFSVIIVWIIRLMQ
ncbi:MAG: DUF2752 domain-containing protein [Spirochaetes bacterium]|nr:DUF2752 domain-containing protein [Spirochaetota bacterium]